MDTPLWVGVVESFDHETSVGVFSTRENALDWVDAHVERTPANAEYIDGRTREERIAWWFGDPEPEAPDGTLSWGDGACFATVSPRIVDAPPLKESPR